MAQAPVMPLWTDALLGDTTHLSAEEFGAYMLLLLTMWRHNGRPLPDNDRQLAQICRVNPWRWRRVLRPILMPFFEQKQGSLFQKRLDEEWSRVVRRKERNTKNLRRTSGKPNGAPTGLPSGESTRARLLNHEPLTNTLSLFDRVSESRARYAGRVSGTQNQKRERDDHKINQEGNNHERTIRIGREAALELEAEAERQRPGCQTDAERSEDRRR